MTLFDAARVLATLGLLLGHIDHLELAYNFEHLAFHHCGCNLVNSLITRLDSDSAPDISDQLSLDLRHVSLNILDKVISRDDIRVQGGKWRNIVDPL